MIISRFILRSMIITCLLVQPVVSWASSEVDELIDDIGFKPETTIRDGIREFVDWYRQTAMGAL